MPPRIYYNVVYKNGTTTRVAEFIKEENGEFIFRYFPESKIEFPGFPLNKNEYRSAVLWEPIIFRIPNTLRNQYSDRSPEEILEITQGKLVTDHFEFVKQP
ncbi:hypothetical protein HYW83_05495 [Candidatus Peregrinibacteria bacterium]|nr:hypothetical protein [Candidatus Peregrinibacteria bacterium]